MKIPIAIYPPAAQIAHRRCRKNHNNQDGRNSRQKTKINQKTDSIRQKCHQCSPDRLCGLIIRTDALAGLCEQFPEFFVIHIGIGSRRCFPVQKVHDLLADSDTAMQRIYIYIGCRRGKKQSYQDEAADGFEKLR